MKTWIVIAVIVLAAAAAYIYLNPEDAAEIPVVGKVVSPPKEKTTVYKWQDTDGKWHYTNARPPEGTSYEIVEYTRDTNVVPSLKRNGD
jgi:hypothetical protein